MLFRFISKDYIPLSSAVTLVPYAVYTAYRSEVVDKRHRHAYREQDKIHRILTEERDNHQRLQANLRDAKDCS